MIYFACNNNNCNNKDAPYHSEDSGIFNCPVCDEPMQLIPEPIEPAPVDLQPTTVGLPLEFPNQ